MGNSGRRLEATLWPLVPSQPLPEAPRPSLEGRGEPPHPGTGSSPVCGRLAWRRARDGTAVQASGSVSRQVCGGTMASAVKESNYGPFESSNYCGEGGTLASRAPKRTRSPTEIGSSIIFTAGRSASPQEVTTWGICGLSYPVPACARQ